MQVVTGACTLSDHTQAEDFVEQLKNQSVIRCMHSYHANWKQNLRTEDNNIKTDYRMSCNLSGLGHLGRALKR
jgi:hypothetical protein